ARRRGLGCRVFLPARAAAARRAAIAGEGADMVVVDGTYEQACALAAGAAAQDGVLEIADAGDGPAATRVIDGYVTLFAEVGEQVDVVLVPVGVGSLGAAAVRGARGRGTAVIGVEPATAACLTAALDAGRPVGIETPGTSMAGMDCAQVSAAAWPELRDGIARTVCVTDAEAHAAMRELAALGLTIGDCGASTLAALRRADLAPGTRVLLVATEGATDPEAYALSIGATGPPRAPASGRR
ncbi:MAG: pyridoxal-phosphate dependent enzyme, partial [Solirubrobacteraceae bacterium]